MADHSKEARNREAQAKVSYEAEAQALREKSARLKALRLAKEAAELGSAPVKRAPASVGKKKSADSKAKAQPLSDWLRSQQGAGRRS